MANQTVILGVIAKLTDQLSGPLGNIDKKLGKLSSSFGSLRSVALTAFGAVGVGLSAAALVRNMQEAEESTHQLTLAVKNLGAESGITVAQVKDLAGEIQRSTKFSDEAVQDASAALLRFGAVTSSTLKPTLGVVADLAAGMGTDLTNAAYMVGRALADPERGLRMLRQAGIVFTKEQTAAIKKLVETGQEAKASGVILAEVSRIYGGMAAESVNTFSGSLTRLGNVVGDLLEGPEGGLKSATKAMNDFTDVLSDPQTKSNMDAFFGFMINRISEMVQLLGLAGKGLQTVYDMATGNVAKPSALEYNRNALRRTQDANQRKYINKGLPVPEREQRREQHFLDMVRSLQELEEVVVTAQKIGRRGSPTIEELDAVDSKKADKAAAEARKREFEMADLAKTQREAGDIPLQLAMDQLYADFYKTQTVLEDLGTGFEDLSDTAEKAWDDIAEATAESLAEVKGPYDDFIVALKEGLANAALQGKFSMKSLLNFVIAELLRKDLYAAIDKLGEALGGVFNGPKGGGSGGGFFQTAATFIGGLFGKAGGGRTDGPTWVGEEGPELFVPATGGTVYNARAMRAMAGNGGSGRSTKYYDHRTYNISGVETQKVVAYIEQTRREDQRANLRMLERNGLGSMR